MHLEPPVVVVLAGSWRCGEESARCCGSLEKTNIDLCLFISNLIEIYFNYHVMCSSSTFSLLLPQWF